MRNLMNINVDLLLCSIIFLIKRVWWSKKNEILSNKKLAEELHKPIIRKVEKKKYTHVS